MVNQMMLRQLGLLTGLLIRLLLPALYVWYNTDDFKWDHKYTKQFALSFVIAILTIINGYTPPGTGITGYELFMASVKDGIILEEGVNQFRKWDNFRVEKMFRERVGNE